MNPHPRIRKTVKWGGAAVTLLLLVVWIGSGWYAAVLNWRGYAAIWGGGRLHALALLDDPANRDLRCYINRNNGVWRWHWWFGNIIRAPGLNVYCIPLWSFAVAALVPTAAAWRLDTLARRRARPGHCPRCGYDRSGLPLLAGCPECGSGAQTSN